MSGIKSGRQGWIGAGAGTGVLLLAVLYRFPPDRFPIYPRCPFHDLTGLLCPGCGATRALAALLHGNLHEAWQLNALFVMLLPLAVGYVTVALSRSLRGRPWPVPKPGAVYMLLGVALLFMILRNTVPV